MVSDAWRAVVAESKALEGSAVTRCAPGSSHNADMQMYVQQRAPPFLRKKDLSTLEEVKSSRDSEKLAEHVRNLEASLSALEGTRPNDAETLKAQRLPYLKNVLESLKSGAERMHEPVSSNSFYDSSVFDPKQQKQQALQRARAPRQSSGRDQVKQAAGHGLIHRALSSIGAGTQGPKVLGSIRRGSGFHGPLFGNRGELKRPIHPAAPKDGAVRHGITERAGKVITANDAEHVSGHNREEVDNKCKTLPQRALDVDSRRAHRHSYTYAADPTSRPFPMTSRLDSQKRALPDEHNHESHDKYEDSERSPPSSKRPKNGTSMSRRGGHVKPSPRQEEQVIDLMDSDEEAREFQDRAEPLPQLEQPGCDDAEAPDARRTRSRSGSKRALSPSNMNIDSDLEGLRYKYPENQMVGSVEVTGYDLLTLKPCEFVNDTIMDYYSKRIADRYREWYSTKETTVRLHWFNSFFYKKLTERCRDSMGQNVTEDMYKKVCKWTKNVDVFAQDYLLMPIHDAAHWSLAIICHPGSLGYQVVEQHKQAEIARRARSAGHASTSHDSDDVPQVPMSCILHLDPINGGGHDTDQIGHALRQWLRMEWENDVRVGKQVKGPDGQLVDCEAVRDTREYLQATNQRNRNMLEIRDLIRVQKIRRIPKQDNYYDCGLYTLTYMEFFAYRTPNEIWPKPGGKGGCEMNCRWYDDKHQHYSFLSKTWFNQLNGSNLRGRLMVELLGLMLKKAWNDGLAEELGSQMQAAQMYVDHFSADYERNCYHSPEDMAQRPELASPHRRKSARAQKKLAWAEAKDQQQLEHPSHDAHQACDTADLFADAEEEGLAAMGLGAGHNRADEADPDYVEDVEVQSTVDENRDDPISGDDDAVDHPVQSDQQRRSHRVTRHQAAQQEQQAHHPPRRLRPRSPQHTTPAEGYATDNIDTDSTEERGQDSRHGDYHQDHDDPRARHMYSQRPNVASNGYVQDDDEWPQHQRAAQGDNDVATVPRTR